VVVTSQRKKVRFCFVFWPISNKINKNKSTKKVNFPVFADGKANAGTKGTVTERTYIMIKPDGVQRGLVHFLFFFFPFIF